MVGARRSESKRLIEAQDKITKVVQSYKQFYPDEYAFVTKEIKRKRGNLKNKYGTTGMDVIERPMTEVPETLFFLLQKLLTEQELQYYSSKTGTRWFQETFSDFSSSRT